MVTIFVQDILDDAGRAEDEERCVDEVISLELRLGSDAEPARSFANSCWMLGVETIGSVSIALTMPTGNVIFVVSRRRLKIKLLMLHLAGQFSNAVKMLGGR